MSRWVVDTGPLIFLAKLDRLDLLRSGAEEIFIPSAVLAEVRARPDEATLKIDTALESWLHLKEVDNQEAVQLLLADLDYGEAEVIVLAREITADQVVMDDLDGRRFVRRVGLASIGTLGLLLAARLRDEIPSVKAEIERLQALGFWASKGLVHSILEAAGEV